MVLDPDTTEQAVLATVDKFVAELTGGVMGAQPDPSHSGGSQDSIGQVFLPFLFCGAGGWPSRNLIVSEGTALSELD